MEIVEADGLTVEYLGPTGWWVGGRRLGFRGDPTEYAKKVEAERFPIRITDERGDVVYATQVPECDLCLGEHTEAGKGLCLL